MIFELLWAQITEGRVEPPTVVDVVDEARKISDDIGEALVGHRVDGFDFHGFHEALCLGVVAGISAPAHRADQAVRIQELAIDLGGVLRSLVRMMLAAGRRLAPFNGDLESGNRRAGVDRPADGVADDAARSGVENETLNNLKKVYHAQGRMAEGAALTARVRPAPALAPNIALN